MFKALLHDLFTLAVFATIIAIFVAIYKAQPDLEAESENLDRKIQAAVAACPQYKDHVAYQFARYTK